MQTFGVLVVLLIGLQQPQLVLFYSGSDAAKSGTIGTSSVSWMQVTTTIPIAGNINSGGE